MGLSFYLINSREKIIPRQTPFFIATTTDQNALVSLFREADAFFYQEVGCRGRDHGLQDLCLTMITFKCTLTPCDGDRRVFAGKAVVREHAREVKCDAFAKYLPGNFPGLS